MDENRMTRRDFGRALAGGALIAVATQRRVTAGEGQDADGRFSFGVIADAQYCDANPAGTRHYRASAKKLAQCVDAFNEMDLAFVIHLGDFIDRDFESYDVMVPIYSRLKPPRYHALGNHDFSVATDKIEDVAAKLGLEDRYFEFRTKGWRFVVLDGNDLSLFARRKGTPEYEHAHTLYQKLKKQNAPNAQTWNGAKKHTHKCTSKTKNYGRRIHYVAYHFTNELNHYYLGLKSKKDLHLDFYLSLRLTPRNFSSSDL